MRENIVLTTEWNIKYGGAENVNIALSDIFIKPVEIRSIWNENENLEPNKQSIIRLLKWLPKSLQGLLSLPYHLVGIPRNSKLLISSSFMFSHLSRIRGGGRHLVYIHTPVRYIWNPEIDNRVASLKFLFRFISWLVKRIERRFLDKKAIFIVNSEEVKHRVLEYWGIESEVIHPPVDVTYYSQFLRIRRPNEIRLISAGRFVPYKNHEQAIELARITGINLILAGSGPHERYLRQIAESSGANVNFEINPSREKLAELISHSSIYLHLAHEDFGILPIEAMATGTPVLGYAIGGLKETVNSRNGYLVNEFAQLIEGIKVCLTRNRSTVASTVNTYSTDLFKKRIAMSIVSHWPELTPDIKEECIDDFKSKFKS